MGNGGASRDRAMRCDRGIVIHRLKSALQRAAGAMEPDMPRPANLLAEIFGSRARRTTATSFDITAMAPVTMRLVETGDGTQLTDT
jgi:hypothetical protein